jgi:isochorismate hydrolase
MSYVNKADWAIEPHRCALLIHDMQPHYLAALPGEVRGRLLGRVRDLLDACLGQEVPVFASHASPARRGCDRGLMRDMWGAGPSTAAETLHPALIVPVGQLYPVAKRSYSAFYGTDLEIGLRRHGRDSLIIAGIYTSIGCHYTAIDAFARDMRCFLPDDATADFTPADHAAGLARSALTCARIVTAEEVLRAME